ncbi:MAG: fatty acid desaturase, partial [Inquilinus sp.]|nr:fatty acid desaturase [Inquilinus sp.]
AALGWPPLSLWLPYALYRASHLAHHNNDRLTEPLADPESFYVTPAEWSRSGPARRALLWANRTLIGRLAFGPALIAGRFLGAEARAIARGVPGRRGLWARHALEVTAVLVWVVAVCDIPLWLYLAGFCYPGLSLTLLRSYAEHRPAVDPADRTAVVRAGPIFGLLFLNNNLHVAHHARPGLAWYRLPALNRRIDGDRRAAIGAGWYRGYGALAWRHLLRPLDHPAHPHAGISPEAAENR